MNSTGKRIENLIGGCATAAPSAWALQHEYQISSCRVPWAFTATACSAGTTMKSQRLAQSQQKQMFLGQCQQNMHAALPCNLSGENVARNCKEEDGSSLMVRFALWQTALGRQVADSSPSAEDSSSLMGGMGRGARLGVWLPALERTARPMGGLRRRCLVRALAAALSARPSPCVAADDTSTPPCFRLHPTAAAASAGGAAAKSLPWTQRPSALAARVFCAGPVDSPARPKAAPSVSAARLSSGGGDRGPSPGNRGAAESGVGDRGSRSPSDRPSATQASASSHSADGDRDSASDHPPLSAATSCCCSSGGSGGVRGASVLSPPPGPPVAAPATAARFSEPVLAAAVPERIHASLSGTVLAAADGGWMASEGAKGGGTALAAGADSGRAGASVVLKAVAEGEASRATAPVLKPPAGSSGPKMPQPLCRCSRQRHSLR